MLTPNQIDVALYEPEIPGNAGAIARTCGATGAPLHLIGRLGFSFTHPKAKRALMDYWQHVDYHVHVAWSDFAARVEGRRIWMFTTRAEKSLWDAEFAAGDVLLFGPESRGLPDEVLALAPAQHVRIPMRPETRSLNLSTAAGVALYEALRQVERVRHKG